MFMQFKCECLEHCISHNTARKKTSASYVLMPFQLQLQSSAHTSYKSYFLISEPALNGQRKISHHDIHPGCLLACVPVMDIQHFIRSCRDKLGQYLQSKTAHLSHLTQLVHLTMMILVHTIIKYVCMNCYCMQSHSYVGHVMKMCSKHGILSTEMHYYDYIPGPVAMVRLVQPLPYRFLWKKNGF